MDDDELGRLVGRRMTTLYAVEPESLRADSASAPVGGSRSSGMRRGVLVAATIALVATLGLVPALVRRSPDAVNSGASPAAVPPRTVASSPASPPLPVSLPPYRFDEVPHNVVIPVAKRPAVEPLGVTFSNGDQLRLDDGGHELVIAFTASWCGPCEPTLRALRAAGRSSATRPVLVAVAVHDPRRAARAFARELGVRIVLDPRGALARRLGHTEAAALPVTVFVDPSGRVAAVYTSAMSERLVQRVERAAS